MRWGEDRQAKQALEQEYLKSIKNGVIWFAWYPVRLHDGRWVWLERITKHYDVYEDHRGLLYKSNWVIYKCHT